MYVWINYSRTYSKFSIFSSFGVPRATAITSQPIIKAKLHSCPQVRHTCSSCSLPIRATTELLRSTMFCQLLLKGFVVVLFFHVHQKTPLQLLSSVFNLFIPVLPVFFTFLTSSLKNLYGPIKKEDKSFKTTNWFFGHIIKQENFVTPLPKQLYREQCRHPNVFDGRIVQNVPFVCHHFSRIIDYSVENFFDIN